MINCATLKLRASIQQKATTKRLSIQVYKQGEENCHTYKQQRISTLEYTNTSQIQ